MSETPSEPIARSAGTIRGYVLDEPALVDSIAAHVRAQLDGGDAELSADAKARLAGSGPVHVDLRAAGRGVASEWSELAADATQEASLADAISRAKTAAGADLSEVDALVVAFSYDFVTVDMLDEAQRKRLHSNIHRGVRGIELSHGDAMQRWCPTTMLATNRKPQKVIDNFRNERRLSVNDLRGPNVTLRTFDAAAIWVERQGDSPGKGSAPRQEALIRGTPYFPIEEVTHENVKLLEQELGDFMVRSVHDDGRMMYMFYPSRGTEDQKRQNMIRQWMATLSLCRLGHFRNDPKVHAVAEKNVRYNLRKFYHASGKMGLIEWNKKVKLGALSLAILSLYEHPKRKQFKRQEQRMRATLDFLWQDTGEFRTFFKPADRNDVQNFYPGEAQLCWAFMWRENHDDALLERFMKSFRYYRDWHFVPENRNPAFIPWHAQAYYNVWLETKDPELAKFVFDMSDWLLGVQQWEDVDYDDAQGRFHDPNRPFGPAHASSTGVYMEGLIDAFCLARELGEDERRETYRRSIIRGLRSLNQLIYRDEIDMWYARDRDILRGGVPTTVYDNIVRIDNIQHNLMAILKILREFEPGDYRP